MRLRYLWMLVSVGFASVLVACSADGLDDEGDRSSFVVASPVPEVAADRSFVLGITADGMVTAAELERAYQAFVGCLEDGGGNGQYFYDLRFGSGIAYEVGIPGDGPAGVATERLIAVCEASFIGDAEMLYDRESPTTQDQLDQRQAEIVACVAAIDPAFRDLDPDTSVNDLLRATVAAGEDRQAITECVTSGGTGRRPIGTGTR